MPRTVAESVLRLLREHGPQTRSLLATELGVSRTTISAEIATLYRSGLVADGPVAPSSGGRRSRTVRLGPALRIAAVSVSESRIRAAVLDGQFTVSRPITVDVQHDTNPAAGTLDAVRKLLGANRSVVAVGLSLAPELAGVTDPFPSELVANIVDLTSGGTVIVERAAHAMARGERHSGVGRGQNDLAVVRIGATVSTATYMDGHLGRGHDDLAGAIGHTKVDEFGPSCPCGSSGCLDSFASLHALREQAEAAARSGRSPALAAVLQTAGAVGLPDLAAAVADGDPVSVQLARDVGRRVGEAVAALVALANPTTVVIGGPVAALGPQLLNEVRGAVYRRSPARVVAGVSIVLGTRGDRSALLGAALRASDSAFGRLAADTTAP